MPYPKRFLLTLLILACLGLVWLTNSRSGAQGAARQAATITVSGVVTGPGGPVSDVSISIASPQDWQETSTDANGLYSVSIQTEGELWFHVYPDVSARLAQINRWIDGVSASFTQNFSVTAGYLLDLQLTGSGALITEPTWLAIQSLGEHLPEHQWYNLDWQEPTARYQAVLPPDTYYITAPNPPAGYYRTSQPFDLRTADQVADLPLNTTYVHPIPYDPPDASRITFSPVDGLGQATVSGAPGAALPLAHVLLVNLSTNHQAHTTAEADGSFTARIYAPPGSAVMIKHGPPDWRWSDLDVGVAEGLNPYPGTMFNLPHTHSAGEGKLPFASVGAINVLADDVGATRNYVGAAWAVTGTLGPVVVEGAWTRVFSGTYDGQPTPGLYLGGLNWTHPTLVDLDDDGDLDLLVGERSGHLALYRNQGVATSPDWQFETADYAGVNTGGWAYPALADVTNDGAPDLFVGAGDGTLSIYYNDGTPTQVLWPASPDESLSVGENAAPALADLDDDGDLDLLVGHVGSTLYHFQNTGTLTNPVWMQRTDSYGGVSEPGHGLQPSFVDLDGDDDPDLLIGRHGDLVWYRNNGPPNAPTWTRVTDGYMGFGGSSAVSPASGDWDGDGNNDLVTGEHWGVLRFFRNDGSTMLTTSGPPTWTEQDLILPFDLAGDSAPALADWDDDGDMDLLLGQAHGQVHQYTNGGSAAAPDWRPDDVLLTLPWTNHPHVFPTLADIDGDDDYDLFIGEGGWQGLGAGGNIHYYRNDGTPAAPTWTPVVTNFLGLDVGGWSTPVFVDIDADADLDLFVGDEAGTLTFVQNTGTPLTPTWDAPVQPYAGLDLGGYSAPSFFDVDQDGDLDMLVGLESGSLAYVRNTGAADSPAWELVSTTHPDIDVGERAVPTAADVNGDGQPDLLIGDGDGGLNLYLYQGSGAPPATDDTFAPGDLLQIEGSVRLYSPAITATTDVETVSGAGWLNLMLLYDEAGQPLAGENTFMSTRLTPSGFPIQHPGRAIEGLDAHVNVVNLHYLGGHAIEGEFSVSAQLPNDLPSGVYRPLMSLYFNGVPTSTEWVAANVTRYTFGSEEAALPPIRVEPTPASVRLPSRLVWRLLMDDFVQGTRGTGAREDRGTFEMSSQIVSQGAPYYTPPVDVRTGQPITYRLEPFMPMISFTDRRMPTPPLIPFDLPGGQLRVVIQEPDGTLRDLGRESLAQSFNRTKTTRAGEDLNSGTVQLEDVYSLQAASDRFRVAFDQYGHHTITMTGVISDIWGNSYSGGGTYDLWMAHPLDIDPGVLPGTPLAVDDALNPALQVYPRVPAQVNLSLTLYPDSDPLQATTHTLSGQANLYGYFSGVAPITLTHPGEYRVDLTAIYTDTDGALYMGAMTWGGIVMTPENEAQLIAHGRRGVDFLANIPNHWFISCRDLPISPDAIGHTLNAYFNGDIVWSRREDTPGDCPAGVSSGGDSLVMGASVQDTVGDIKADIRARAERMHPPTAPPGNLDERFAKDEIPLFTSTRSGKPVQLAPDDVDQIAYSYRTSQRPGVRVRELVAQDGESGGYWRLNTLYDDQLGVGVLGDQPNDFKFQYVGAVYRDLERGHNEYVGQGSGWVLIPQDDPTGSRVMPPFAGYGGWTDEGGPILTLKGEDVHIFILPTGVQPGAVLQAGDVFRFAGHIMPTLDSQVALTLTAPGGTQYLGGGQANRVGYFYDPHDDVIVNEPGLWSVDVRVWHEGQCSGGATSPPYPSGDVLGSESGPWSGGRYWFYVVPAGNSRLDVSSPSPGFMTFDGVVTPIVISGTLPAGLSNATLDYTIRMPGYILAHGQVTLDDANIQYLITFDPAALHQDFPNLDLIGRDEHRAGLADTFAIGLLLRGQRDGGTVYRANTITIQGEQAFIGSAPPGPHVDCPNPLLGVSIFGLDSGYTGVAYTFSTQINPVNASAPITYTWSTAGLSSQGTTSATYNWDAPGVYSVSLTAENCDGPVHAERTMTLSQQPPGCDYAITGVTIDGPARGDEETDYYFIASVAPPSATLPISYTWSANALVNGQNTISATYRWSQPGMYDVAVNAGNCGGSAHDAHSIEIGQAYVYLPIIMRNY